MKDAKHKIWWTIFFLQFLERDGNVVVVFFAFSLRSTPLGCLAKITHRTMANECTWLNRLFCITQCMEFYEHMHRNRQIISDSHWCSVAFWWHISTSLSVSLSFFLSWYNYKTVVAHRICRTRTTFCPSKSHTNMYSFDNNAILDNNNKNTNNNSITVWHKPNEN